MVTGHRVLPRFAKLRPDSLEELAKHVDRVLAKDLREIQINTHKQVKLTVVFWDISNFSNLCEDFVGYPGVLIDLLSKYFAKAIKIIKKHNGVLDKFMGDGILAYFGYNGKEEDGDPSNAIRAALEFKKQFPTLKTNFAQLCKEIDIKKRVRRFDLKCGMNIGYVHVHYFNTTSRNSVVCIGSTLNLASRLEGIAKKDEIIVSRKLMNVIRGQYAFTPISVKRRIKENIKSFKKEKVVYSIKGKR